MWRDGFLHSSRGSWPDSEERAAYAIGEKAGEEAPMGATLPNAAELNMMAQQFSNEQGSGEQQSWDLAFENGYADGFKKTHPAP
jgi:hypothetical protein